MKEGRKKERREMTRSVVKAGLKMRSEDYKMEDKFNYSI
jgi:hypothetical protein